MKLQVIAWLATAASTLAFVEQQVCPNPVNRSCDRSDKCPDWMTPDVPRCTNNCRAGRGEEEWNCRAPGLVEVENKADRWYGECMCFCCKDRSNLSCIQLRLAQLSEKGEYENCSCNCPIPEGPQGPEGCMGPIGAPGQDGCDGPRGPRGPAAYHGKPGYSGEHGENGLSAHNCDYGEDGTYGIDGVPGRDGLQGPAGPMADDGVTGFVGLDGPVGPQGPDGAMGERGEAGEMGPDGPEGRRGRRGDEGSRGEMGVPGPMGPMGPRGEMGRRGPVGQPGEKGDAGFDGENGVQGPRGLPGDVGAPGPRGLSGDNGKDSDLVGEPGTPGDMGPPGPDGDVLQWEWSFIETMVSNSLFDKLHIFGDLDEYCADELVEMCDCGAQTYARTNGQDQVDSSINQSTRQTSARRTTNNSNSRTTNNSSSSQSTNSNSATRNVNSGSGSNSNPSTNSNNSGRPVKDLIIMIDSSDATSETNFAVLRKWISDFVQKLSSPVIQNYFSKVSFTVILQYSDVDYVNFDPETYLPPSSSFQAKSAILSDMKLLQEEVDSMIRINSGKSTSNTYTALEMLITDVIPTHIDKIRNSESESDASPIPSTTENVNRSLILFTSSAADDRNSLARQFRNPVLLEKLNATFESRYIIGVGSDIDESELQELSGGEEEGVYFTLTELGQRQMSDLSETLFDLFIMV